MELQSNSMFQLDGHGEATINIELAEDEGGAWPILNIKIGGMIASIEITADEARSVASDLLEAAERSRNEPVGANKVTDGEILEQFEICKERLGRNGFHYQEIAMGLSDKVTPEAVRQRLHQMDGSKVESIKSPEPAGINGLVIWKKPGDEVFF